MKIDRSKPFALLFIAVLVAFSIKAQSVHFNFTDGTSSSYSLEDVRKVTYDSDMMNIYLLDGSIYSWNLSAIGNYQYSDSPINIANLLSTWEASIYPNPTNKLLHINFNLPEENEITITLFDLQGKLVVEKALGKKPPGENQEVLDISTLLNGTYICRIISENTTITKKVIKY